jgi:predicted phosphate transport protein (TIGR00153 family)
MTTTISFKQLLGGSPFPPMMEHMSLAAECVDQIPPMLHAIFDKQESRIKEFQAKVFEAETKADHIYDQLSANLPQTKYLPVHRHDVITVLQHQEAIADTAQDIAGILSVNLDIAPELREPVLGLANKAQEAVQIALKVIKSLNALVETGFEGPDVDHVHELIDQLIQAEDGADMLGIELMNILHSHHKDKDPVSTIFTYEIIRWLGAVADYAELVGSHMRLLIAAK